VSRAEIEVQKGQDEQEEEALTRRERVIVMYHLVNL
jgi:hypothetical protein